MNSEFTYTLIEPVEVMIDGRQETCDEVVIKAPRPRDKVPAMALEGLFMKLFFKVTSMLDIQATDDQKAEARRLNQEKSLRQANSINVDQTEEEKAISLRQEDKEKENEASTMMSQIVAGAVRDDIQTLMNLFSELITDGNRANPQATIGGEAMTKPMVDDIGLEDTKILLGKYFTLFLSSN